MKKSFMTRALAMGLSLAMAFSLSAATNVSVASAAAKPAMNSKTMTVKVGQSKNYKATTATQKAYKITKVRLSKAGQENADVTISSTGKSIKVTGKSATKSRNLVIRFQNRKTKKSQNITTKVVVKEAVAEVAKISSVKQDTFTEFTVTMSKALETAAAADFGMVRDDDNQVITVRSAALDATDKTKVKLTVYTSLTDAKTYTVTYTASDAAKTQSTAKVTVTDGTVADVALTPLEITANKETVIKYQTLDATGVIVSEGLASKATGNVSVTWDSLLGTMDESSSKYILYNVGDTAKFTVTYNTFKYDPTTGAQIGVITKDFTVTAVKDASVISQYTYTVAAERPFDWSKVTPKQTVALEDTDREAYFLIKDSKGNNVTATCGYTVESSDNSIVVADGLVTGTDLRPVAKGSAYLMIKDADGKVVHTLPITVGDKRTLSTFKLSAGTVNVVSGAAFDDNVVTKAALCGYTDVVAKDQYGENIAVNLDIKKTTNNNLSDKVREHSSHSYLIVEGQSQAASEVYTITATDANNKSMPTTLRVNTVEAKNTPTYSVVFVKGTGADAKVVSEIDTTVSESTSAVAPTSQAVTAYIVKKQNNVVSDILTTGKIKGMTIRKNDGTVVAKVVSETTIAKTEKSVVTSAAVVATKAVVDVVTNAGAYNNSKALVVSATAVSGSGIGLSGKCVTKTLGVGTYTVTFDLIGADGSTGVNSRPDRAQASFAVKDSQTPVTAVVKDTNCTEGGQVKTLLGVGKYVDYKYGDVVINGVGSPSKAKVTVSNGDKNAFVSNVTVEVQVADTTHSMIVTVPVNKTFITTGTKWDKVQN